MKIRLRGGKVREERLKKNDSRTSVLAVLSFISVILLYMYLFTDISAILGVPSPEQLAFRAWGTVNYVFDHDNVVAFSPFIDTEYSQRPTHSLLVLFIVIMVAFVSVYFLKPGVKKPACVFWFLVAFTWIFGPVSAVLLLASHMLVYLILHPAAKAHSFWLRVFSGLAAALVYYRFFHLGGVGIVLSLAVGVFIFALLSYFIMPFIRLKNTFRTVIQTLVIQTPIIFAVTGAISEGFSGKSWEIPMGLLFLFWQWTRLMVYHVDLKNGDVPMDMPLSEYLSVFMNPAIISDHRNAPYVGQGYAYLSSKFYRRDKNLILRDGITLLALALFYFTFANWFLTHIITGLYRYLGVMVYNNIYQMVDFYVSGTPMSTPTVLATSFLDQVRIFLVFGAITHFRVGLWRAFGYDMDPQYNKPWLATNLVSLWGRFAFHYREFLVRVFYFPVFFGMFKTRPYLRVFAATMMATVVGNMFWGHIPDHLYYRGITLDYLILLLRGWPYYLLLGLGISLTQLYLMRRPRTRKPWSMDRRLMKDILFAYLTFQFFSLIHIFSRTNPNSTLADHLKLFIIGLGISW